MPYVIRHNAPLSIIEVIFTGRITGADLEDSTSAAVSLGRRTGIKNFLADTTGMESGAPAFDLFKLPHSHYHKEGIDQASTRLAVILPESKRERDDLEFYETACVNRGWRVRLFSGLRDAIDWLAGNTTASAPPIRRIIRV